MPDPDPETPPPPPFVGLALPPPEPFSFDPDDWPAYRTKVERWFEISVAHSMTARQKRQTLLYTMGSAQADQIVATFRDSVTETMTLPAFLDLFDTYFHPKTNFVAACGKFWDRRQQEGETNEEYIRIMHQLVDKCDYGALKDRMLRDKLCHGMFHRRMAADLRGNQNLNLQDVISAMRTKEALLNDLKQEKERALEQLKKVKAEASYPALDAVRKKQPPRSRKQWKPQEQTANSQGQPTPSTSTSGDVINACKFCSGTHRYGLKFCPAKDAICNSCGKKGHFAKICFKTMRALGREEGSDSECFSDEDRYMVHAVSANSPHQWRAKVQVGSYWINFKADSGADVTAISLTDFMLLRPSPTTKPPKSRLVGACREPLDTVLVFLAEMKYQGNVHSEKIYVVRSLEDNLLSRSACDALFVVEFKGDKQLTTGSPPERLAALATTDTTFLPWSPKERFPKCFQGLGLMKAEYKITLRPDAAPYSIPAPRRIPHPIRNQVKAQLDNMVTEGVISPVLTPTEWCAALVPVPKASDPTKIRLCVDHIQLNKAILRERTILPSVEDTMAQFAGAQFFSKLDCNDSFWQVRLHPQSHNNEFIWGPLQTHAFEQTKKLLSESPVLAHYDPNLNHRLASDASLMGLGAVLEQEHQGMWRPVCYASRRLSETESRYAVIEREALGIVWACQKFHDFLMGKQFHILTDHKPLVSILGTKNLSDMTPRLQRMRLKLLPYSYEIAYIPGRDHHLPDWLSRSPPESLPASDELKLVSEVSSYSQHATCSIPIVDEKLNSILEATSKDKALQTLVLWIQKGFPLRKGKWSEELTFFWTYRSDLSEQDGLILFRNRIIVPAYPTQLRESILKSLHEGHQSLTTMRARARVAVYWPGLSSQLTTFIDQCETCCRNKTHHVEPLIPSPTPDYPWQKVALDVAEVNGIYYLIIIDYYSRYIEWHQLNNLTSGSIVIKCKETFARHGIPAELHCDNAPPLVGSEFKKFLIDWGIVQITSSPYYPKSNGQAEAAVKIAKRILKDCADPQLGLLAYRNTPIAGLDASPAQLSMSRHLRSTIPVPPQKLSPAVSQHRDFKIKNDIKKEKQKLYHDKHHGAKEASVLPTGSKVWMRDIKRKGHILKQAGPPRSYLVQTTQGVFRRNRVHLTRLPEGGEDYSDIGSELDDSDTPTHTYQGQQALEQQKIQEPPPQLLEPPQNPPQAVSPGRRTRSGRLVRIPGRYL
ncbi:UNVERIFIED_CONTAM: hypothetical protein B566_EDAN019553 [Ephemera danica]|nr:hypothetical protein B566_EDAN019553 [Ephemera danica]